MPSDGPQVEFNREVIDAQLEGEQLLGQSQAFWRSVGAVRWATLVAGAAALAYLTRRSGLTLDGALCVFLGLLPVLWIISWMTGMSFGARRAANLVRSAVRQAGVAGRETRAERPSQRVHLAVGDEGLEVTLTQADKTESHRWPWRKVQLLRRGGDAFWLQSEHNLIEVPRSAFADAQAFDAFALAAQAKIWSAMR